jgi:hypothetical protein
LRRSLSDNHFYQIHLADHILESSYIGVRDLATVRDVAERMKVLQQVIGELVFGSLEDNALEVLRLNISITILIKEVEGLSYPLSL